MKNKLYYYCVFIIIIFFSFNSNSKEENINNFLDKLEQNKNSIYEDRLIKNQPENRFVNNVKLQGLNKITGKTFKIETKINNVLNFERLEIIPLKCWKSYPEESPENKLLLKIYENNTKTHEKKLIFFGWILSSSPSISGLEHPLYDIRLEDCYNKEDEIKK